MNRPCAGPASGSCDSPVPALATRCPRAARTGVLSHLLSLPPTRLRAPDPVWATGMDAVALPPPRWNRSRGSGRPMPDFRASYVTTNCQSSDAGQAAASLLPAGSRPLSQATGASPLPGGASQLREALPSRRPPSASARRADRSAFAATPEQLGHFADALDTGSTSLRAALQPAIGAYGGTDPAQQDDLSRAVAPFLRWADAVHSPGNPCTPPLPPTAEFPWSLLDTAGSAGTWSDAPRQFPAGIAGVSSSMPSGPSYNAAGRSTAQGEPSQTVWDFTSASSAAAPPRLRRPSASQISVVSVSHRGQRAYWASRIAPDDLRAWGRAVARQDKCREAIAEEVSANYGVPTGTARNWFKVSSSDGLSDDGRRLLNRPAPRVEVATTLNEAQFLQLVRARKSRTSMTEALASIGRSDIPGTTAKSWFDASASDHLSKQGRNALKRIRTKGSGAGR